MFQWLENTPVALWVGESLWAYPLCLGLHATGLAIVVGLFAARDLRLLGLFQGLSLDAFLDLGKFAWMGFVINALSGLLLFTSQATTFVQSAPFLIKIACIALGMIAAAVIQARLRGSLTGGADTIEVASSTRVVALMSLTLWVAAIVTGRLIAYI